MHDAVHQSGSGGDQQGQEECVDGHEQHVQYPLLLGSCDHSNLRPPVLRGAHLIPHTRRE